MSEGRLIAVVGASGVGKDSVINAMVQAAPHLQQVRRVITREAEPDGENHIAVTESEFASMQTSGDFCLDWHAHGYAYGIPSSVLVAVQAGEQCVANLSRSVLNAAARVFPAITVLNITAESATLAERLAVRGRESVEEIHRRLERVGSPIAEELNPIDIANDGPLANTVADALGALGLSTTA